MRSRFPKQQSYPVIFSTSALRLVLIDDSPDDCASAIRALEQEFPSLQVQQPTNADDLARVLRFGHFDLAIVSEGLSWLGGVASIKAIKATHPHCQVVVWTDSQSVEAAVAVMKAGAADYILKSPAQERLVAAVQELCSSEESKGESGAEGNLLAGLEINRNTSDRQCVEATKQLMRYTSELEERVAERTLELQQSNAELEAFSYSVSHDLKAPLRAMQGFANALVEDCGEQLDELGHEYAQRIIKATQRLDRLIQDLLEYSRLGRVQLQLQPVSLESVVAEAIEQLEGEIQAAGAQIQIATKGITPLPKLLGHRATLVQVVSNLLGNAIKFVPDRVRPRIAVWAEERSEASGQVWVRLWVEDNGLGIKPEYQEQVWQVFERLHGRESYPGSGIGLAIVRKAMERMGGRAGVESSPNQGSCFWLEGKTLAKE